MDISSVRLKLSAVAKFQPAAPGSRFEQEIGFFDLSADIADSDVVHVVRLSVTNFGTTGEEITISANTLQVTLGTGAAATVTDGDGLDFDKVTIDATAWSVVGIRVVSADEGTGAVVIKSGDVRLAATPGKFAISAVDPAAFSDDFTLEATTGALSPATVLELLFIGA